MKKFSAQSFGFAQDFQKGAIAPIILLGLLVLGIFVTTKLVNIPQIFKSRASIDRPVAPQNLRVSCSNETRSYTKDGQTYTLIRAGLTWDQVSGVSGYKSRLYNIRDTWNPDPTVCSNLNHGTEILRTNSSYCRNTSGWLPENIILDLIKDDTYDFWVQATNDAGDSIPTHLSFSCPASNSTPSPIAVSVPAAPQNLSVDCTKGPQPFSWDKVPNATSYKIRINNTKDGFNNQVCNKREGQNGWDWCENGVGVGDTSSRIIFPYGDIGPTDTYDFWVHASNSAGDSTPTHFKFICPNNHAPTIVVPLDVSTPVPVSIPNPNGRPSPTSFTTDSPTGVNLKIGGQNFGSQKGFIYFSLGKPGEDSKVQSEYLVQPAKIQSWTDTEINVNVEDVVGAIVNQMSNGLVRVSTLSNQYIRVCQFDQNLCSDYITLPDFAAGGGGRGGV